MVFYINVFSNRTVRTLEKNIYESFIFKMGPFWVEIAPFKLIVTLGSFKSPMIIFTW